MGVIFRKYGDGTTIDFPMLDAGTTNYATNTDWTPASGDTQISKDEGSFANTTNTPAHEGRGSWSLALTATEMQAARIVVNIVDSATKAVEDQEILIETYGHASAQHAFDLGTAMSGQAVASVTGAVGSVTGNLGGNVTGSVGSVTGNVGGNVAGSVDSVTDPVTVGAVNSAGQEDIWETDALAESYAADGAAATPAQLLYMLLAMWQFTITGTSISHKKLDGSTQAFVHTMDDADSPTESIRTG